MQACDGQDSIIDNTDAFLSDAGLKPDMIAEFNPEIAIIKDVEPAQPTFDSTHRIFRLRVWNAKTREGRSTNVEFDLIEEAISYINAIFHGQCGQYGYNISVELASVGTYLAPDRCFDDKMHIPDQTLLRPIDPKDCWIYYLNAGYIINEERGDPNYVHLFFIDSFQYRSLSSLAGFANENGGNSIVVDTKWGQANTLLTIIHELGHILGGCANFDDESCFSGHIDFNDDRCQQRIPPPNGVANGTENLQNHLMCDYDNGIIIDKITCAYYYDVLGPGKSQIANNYNGLRFPLGPWNFSEECDQIDNDMDGEIDENCD
ncbi:hypothetical protein KKF91_03235 [Myxococcota bacterium]|nr:hypothetical protein [Myxococcota bacterium]